MVQRLIPGVGYIDETGSAQRLIPGIGYVSETTSTLLDYTITPSGGVAYNGTTNQVHVKIFDPAGTITLNGTAALLLQSPTTFTITPSGSVIYSGNGVLSKVSVMYPTGALGFSGNTTINKVKVFPTTGTLTLSGTADLIVPGEVQETTKLPLTGVGA